MKIIFLAPYPLRSAPSQRFRFEHFFKSMEEKGFIWEFQSFLTEKGWSVIYSNGNWLSKITSTLAGFLIRLLLLFRIRSFDLVFIHRELTPFGPPVFEWLISRVFRKKVIYDFDDAIWMSDRTQESTLWRWLKWRNKVALLCKWSWKVSVGNNFLGDFARQHCSHVVLIPTIVNSDVHARGVSALRQAQRDTHKQAMPDMPEQAQHDIQQAQSDTKANPQHNHINTLTLSKPAKPTIGWTGSHSTLAYLDDLIPVLKELQSDYKFTFLVIANKNPHLPLDDFEFINWSQEYEVEDLLKIDIGVMPLKDTHWEKGKCGFKLIQYFAMEIPAVASPVGVNNHLIKDNHNGYFARNKDEWKQQLIKLLSDQELRSRMGKEGRKLIESSYSVSSLNEKFLSLFDEDSVKTSSEE
ncbi:MAG: glycosyltransferase [Cyclobacteriaceae bacterium]